MAIVDTPVHSRDYWRQKSDQLTIRCKAFIDGAFVDAKSGETFPSLNPATGRTLANVASCSSADVDAAVLAARRSFESGGWSRARPVERKQVLLRLAQLIRGHSEEFALLDSLDMGKLVHDAATMDVPAAADIFQWYAEAIDKVYDEVAPVGSSALALVTREPVGVVAAVVPWNFPLKMAAWKCAPALAAGNSVILKPAEQSPLSALLLAELATLAGIPDGVFNVLPGMGTTAGKPIGLHADIDCVAFTGSTEVGKYFLGYSSQSNMKQIWLECGGKSPILVFADCRDLDKAARSAAQGIFFNQGEVCSATSRLYVDKRIKSTFLEVLLAYGRQFQPGDPLDPASRMGAMVDREQTERVMSYVQRGTVEADLVLGGNQIRIEGKGFFVEPTIFDNVLPSHVIAQEEIFGPVLSVLEFDSEQQALQMANDSIYGLGASVWTDDLSRAHRVSRLLRVGSVSVNSVDAVSVQTPFGGVKQSGNGRDLSLHALGNYTALKTTWIEL